MAGVLFDTSALYAVVDVADEFHREASPLFDALLGGSEDLWVTSYVLVEAGALIQNRLGFETLKALLRLLDGVVETVWLERTVHSAAWAELDKHDGRGLNFVDWTTYLAADRLKARIFTFDRGFRRMGARVLPE